MESSQKIQILIIMKNFLFSVYIVLVSIFSLNAQALKKTKKLDSLTTVLQDHYQQSNLQGFAVAVVTDTSIVYNHAFGYANAKEQKEYSIHTLQNIASVSKTLIGVSLLKAQEEGVLSLDDPINKYLPFKVTNPYYPKEQITIRQLATHTSTILDIEYYPNRAYVLNDKAFFDKNSKKKFGVELNKSTADLNLGTFLKKILAKDGEWNSKTCFLKEKPGAKHVYSNVGATLAAYILEQALGVSYADYTQEHILKPLRMNSSGWFAKKVDMKQHSVLYQDKHTAIPKYHLVTYPDGGLISNSYDMALFLMELIKGYHGKGILLQTDSYQHLFTEQLTLDHYPEAVDNPYETIVNSGVFMCFTKEGLIGHTGGDPGTIVYMFFNPTTKIGRLIILNTWLSTSKEIEQFYNIWNALDKAI